MSTALTHLGVARSRPNLSLRTGAVVDRLELSRSRARGVRLVGGELVEGDRVILAAGTYASPTILMRSGVGPASHLRETGAAVVVDLPGVGSNLIDHPLVALDLQTSPGFEGPRFQVLLTLRSTLVSSESPPDLHVFAAGPFDEPGSPSGGVFGLVTALLSPRSRGSLRLRSTSPVDPPRIDVAHLRHPDDVAAMVQATLVARRLSRSGPLAALVAGPELAPGPEVAEDDTAGLAHSIRQRVTSYHHPVGTCAMGPDPEGGAVVDGKGAVHGVAGVTVADASVMPTIPSAPTNLTTIVLAQRLAT